MRGPKQKSKFEDRFWRPMSRQRLWQIERREKGLCMKCGRPTGIWVGYCEKHRKKQIKADRKSKAKKRGEKT